ncbi:MAG: long-chain-fatty-acyl-CoA reductase [Lachnospiraceae bacterium]|nr:long-chain-fatty-acyl-CoA reductase [Lachnospiraceae bacterium]
MGKWEDAAKAAPLAPFDDSVLEFFNDISKLLTRVRDYSEVATFGFWCRRSSLLHEKKQYDDLDMRRGRGLVFHSTPSNVPVNFAFSFAAGLLAGNANIVRLPGKDFEQVTIITDAINELLANNHASLAPYACFVKYPPDQALHDQFSALCDVRVIWGGDATISELRQSPLKPRATELTFADRYSIAVINAGEYMKAEDKPAIAQAFYNDTYFSDQNACTAPRLVCWFGKGKDEAKEVFWSHLLALAEEKYELAPVQAVGKLAAFYKAAANLPVSLVGEGDSYLTRVKVDVLDSELMQYKYNSGFFFEHDIDSLADILPLCGERLQTLAYYGIAKEEIAAFITEYGPRGLDRAVPFGKTMDFSLVWDGHDLIRAMSRKVMR